MEVKTENGGTFDAAGNGTKGIAISGLVTGAAALLGSGLLGLFGMNNSGNGRGNNQPRWISEQEFDAEKKYSALFSELEKERGERYTDQAIINYNKDKYEFHREIADAIVEDRQKIAALEQYNTSMKDIFALKEENMNLKFNSLQNQINSSVALEAERRCNGDQNLFNYVNAKFVPGELVMPASSICPECMPRYNSYVAPTTTTTTGQ